MSLYEIEQELLSIFNQLEEQGGEFTEEQLEKLNCTKENFKDKLKEYRNYIQSCKSDINECKEEEARIKDIRKSKENKVNKLQDIMLQAVKEFGDLQKNGVRVIEYPTFKLSTRQSTAVDINEKRIEDFIRLFRNYCDELEVMCALDNPDEIDIEGMLGAINAIYKSECEEGEYVPFTLDDFNAITVKISTDCPLYFLFNEKEYHSVLKALANNVNVWMTNTTNKSDIKLAIDNGNVITIANKVNNLSLQIK